MEILWLAHRDPLNPKAGGAEKIILEVSKRLVDRGYDITILTGGWRNCKRYEFKEGIHIYRYGVRALPHFVLPFFLMKRHFDIVIADLGHAVPWVTPILLRKKTVVSFLHLHARSLPGQANVVLAKSITALEKLYFLFYNKQKFVTISNTSFQDLVGLGINPKNIIKIHPGVNTGLFHPSIKTQYPSMIYYGGMRAYKRPNEAIYLLHELIKQTDNLHLTIVGEGVEKAKLESLISKLNLETNVTFTGRINDEDLSRIVSESWLNIHTSVTEGWGISIVEAAAAGTPTVAYDVPGVSESIENGMNGLRVKDGDRDALKNAALTILNDPKAWSVKAKEAIKKYSWDKTAQSWENLILEVVGTQKEQMTSSSYDL
jgi:glycosyltransferase involved in cell wall biosynthesis